MIYYHCFIKYKIILGEKMVTKKNKTLDMIYIAVGAVLIAICSWIAIPAAVPFTLQTFGIFMVVGLLGGKRGTLSVFIYILLGVIGIPVFAGFSGGVGIILGNTGGYIIGFLFSAITMWGGEKVLGKGFVANVISMIAGILICYTFGTVWFMTVYAHNTGVAGIATILGWCVIPFIIPDLIKILLAITLVRRLGRYVQ